MATATEQPATADNYHDHPAVSRTGLKCFRQSRRLYHARHILRLPEAQMKVTPEIQLGTMAHAELLEPGSLASQYAIFPEHLLSDDGGVRSKAAKQWRDEQQAAGKLVVKQQEVAALFAMVEATKHVAGRWLKIGTPLIEQPIFWRDEMTGLECRCKPDWLIDASDAVYCFDFKTTADSSPSAFARQVQNLELWLQDEHYTRGLRAVYFKPVVFHFVTVSTEFPYQVGVYCIDRTVMQGRIIDEYRDTLNTLAHCVKTDNWSDPWEGRVTRLTLKEWAFASDSVCPLNHPSMKGID